MLNGSCSASLSASSARSGKIRPLHAAAGRNTAHCRGRGVLGGDGSRTPRPGWRLQSADLAKVGGSHYRRTMQAAASRWQPAKQTVALVIRCAAGSVRRGDGRRLLRPVIWRLSGVGRCLDWLVLGTVGAGEVFLAKFRTTRADDRNY